MISRKCTSPGTPAATTETDVRRKAPALRRVTWVPVSAAPQLRASCLSSPPRGPSEISPMGSSTSSGLSGGGGRSAIDRDSPRHKQLRPRTSTSRPSGSRPDVNQLVARRTLQTPGSDLSPEVRGRGARARARRTLRERRPGQQKRPSHNCRLRPVSLCAPALASRAATVQRYLGRTMAGPKLGQLEFRTKMCDRGSGLNDLPFCQIGGGVVATPAVEAPTPSAASPRGLQRRFESNGASRGCRGHLQHPSLASPFLGYTLLRRISPSRPPEWHHIALKMSGSKTTPAPKCPLDGTSPTRRQGAQCGTRTRASRTNRNAESMRDGACACAPCHACALTAPSTSPDSPPEPHMSCAQRRSPDALPSQRQMSACSACSAQETHGFVELRTRTAPAWVNLINVPWR